MFWQSPVRRRARLAGGAPVGGAFAGAVALVGRADGGVASKAGTGRPAVHEQVVVAAACRVADRAVAVGFEEFLGERGQPGGEVLGEGADGDPGGDPEQEAELALVDIADTGEIALVQEGLAEGTGGVAQEVGEGPVGVPVRAEQVGAEVADGVVFVGGADQLQYGEAIADGRAVGVAQDRADLVCRAAAPALAVGVHLPGAVHPQVRVEGQAALDAGEEVLAAGRHLQDGTAGEVGRGVLRYA